MLHQTFLFLGQLWQLFEVSQILEFLRHVSLERPQISKSVLKCFFLSKNNPKDLDLT